MYGLNPVIFNFVGEPVNDFSRFTILGRQAQAVICIKCNLIDANFGPQSKIELLEYDAHLHQCVSDERRNHLVKVIIFLSLFPKKIIKIINYLF